MATRVRMQRQERPRPPLTSQIRKSSTDTSQPHHDLNPILRLQRTVGNQALQRLLRSPLARPISQRTSTLTVQRDPDRTQVHVVPTGSNIIVQLPQGKGGSGAIVYEYSAL